MSAYSGVRVWERGSTEPPPKDWDRWLRNDESLLWSAEVPESAVKLHYRRVAVFVIILAAATAFYVPFGETVSEYCLRDGYRRCASLYWVLWLSLLTCAYEAVRCIWSYLRADSITEPNLYAITTRRALFMPRSKAHRFSDRLLVGRSVQMDVWGDSLVFGGSLFEWTRYFHGLGPDHALNALERVKDAWYGSS